ncbi:6,7-dimethyl-8-ribityllumazine synthase [Candidatus Woesearchaeota archaeon]|nr:6,7-dimethyl-8-ribityllumazine synthase [Candidatus Woesearchaeota archaeon]
MKLGIVVSDTQKKITEQMLALALQTAQQHKAQTQILHVPGSYDIPLAVKKLLEKKDIEGVVTLGVLIKGETDHDALIAYTVANALTDLSLHYNKPVTLGINGPNMTKEQAIERIKRAKKVTEACILMVKTHNSLI